MKITIDNRSSVPDSESLRIVGDLMHAEANYMLDNEDTGCRFEFDQQGFCVSMLPGKIAGERVFWVTDMKKKGADK